MGRLHKRSSGLIMLLLAVVAIAPGVSIVAGLLLMIPASQVIAVFGLWSSQGRPTRAELCTSQNPVTVRCVLTGLATVLTRHPAAK
ncbi:hypothetical protein JQ614_44635 [Bradyrhizobium diazoefficiens]|nr:hypothetical protein [Bradyrhizobium diazoefficiens]MBR0893041.1 hypothetical protein [Bradyrhizobium diazoefficiens]MBR0924727.1 hypothetical protein [Bradyrhizobium diazoefficiens]QHP68112.1 hypothetical protein EI171_13110 [Bradyrhizobium sp. LCT2]